MKYKINIKNKNSEEIFLTEDEILEVQYKIKTVEKSSYVNNRNFVEIDLIGKLVSNLNEGNDSFYEQNKKNVFHLTNWAKSYLEEDDYRDFYLEVNLGSDHIINYTFNDMYIVDFSQEFSVEKGVGIFKIHLKQRFSNKTNILLDY